MSTTTTKPARVLTEEQHKELWELFCSYGQLSAQAEREFFKFPAAYDRLNREARDVQERFNALLWSLTEHRS